MSCNYAEGLSEYEHKGKCGLPETFDSEAEIEEKAKTVAKWIYNSKHVVVHTGAGISTSAGIPDFRGPNGVWTLEQKGQKPNINLSFDAAVPTKTHMALAQMIRNQLIHHIISQNVDGLHLKSGLHRSQFSELHGNMFLDKCDMCKREVVRNTATASVGQKMTGRKCPLRKKNGRPCRGNLRDTILDWEDELPDCDLDASDHHSKKADLSITLGSSLQIVPSGNLPLAAKKNEGGKLVICNLQPTKHDKHADLKINAYVDTVMELVAKHLNFKIAEYDPQFDPTKCKANSNVCILDIECTPFFSVKHEAELQNGNDCLNDVKPSMKHKSNGSDNECSSNEKQPKTDIKEEMEEGS